MVVNSRGSLGGYRVWRRRQCRVCKAVFTSGERAEMDIALRIEKNGYLEPFFEEKLFLDVYGSLSHRKTAYTDAKRLTDTIVSKLLPAKTGLLKDQEVKTTVLQVLKRFDKAAAVHYQAHHIL